jgi:hypothetical protein
LSHRTRMVPMKNEVQFLCCVCHQFVSPDDLDSYFLQVQTKINLPVALWGHGACLREALSVVAEKTPVG